MGLIKIIGDHLYSILREPMNPACRGTGYTVDGSFFYIYSDLDNDITLNRNPEDAYGHNHIPLFRSLHFYKEQYVRIIELQNQICLNEITIPFHFSSLYINNTGIKRLTLPKNFRRLDCDFDCTIENLDEVLKRNEDISINML